MVSEKYQGKKDPGKKDINNYISTKTIDDKLPYFSKSQDIILSKNIINSGKQYLFMKNKSGDLNGVYSSSHGKMPVFNTAPYMYM